MSRLSASVFAPINIALAKYWGKRDEALKLPTHGSLSATLKDLGSTTHAVFDQNGSGDRFVFEDQEIALTPALEIVLEEFRKEIPQARWPLTLTSKNNIPTASGLASSASGLAAATLAINQALGCDWPAKKLSRIARQGSGSASRSLWGGFVKWHAGQESDGTDSFAEQVQSADHWKLQVAVLVIDDQKKSTGSTLGMKHCQTSSPYFNSWVDWSVKNLDEFERAIADRDFFSLARLSQMSCRLMHFSAMTSEPPLFYWSPITYQLVSEIEQDQALKNLSAFYTIDAGSNIVLFYEAQNRKCVQTYIEKKQSSLLGVDQVIYTEIGEGPQVLTGESR